MIFYIMFTLPLQNKSSLVWKSFLISLRDIKEYVVTEPVCLEIFSSLIHDKNKVSNALASNNKCFTGAFGSGIGHYCF